MVAFCQWNDRGVCVYCDRPKTAGQLRNCELAPPAETTPPAGPAPEPCPHLGEPYDDEVQVLGCGCPSQQTSGLATRVFECALHGACAPLVTRGHLADPSEDVKLCHECPDRPRAGENSRAAEL
jgi:hypothetical protein